MKLSCCQEKKNLLVFHIINFLYEIVLEKRKPIKRKGAISSFKPFFSFKPSVVAAFLIGLGAGCAFYPLSPTLPVEFSTEHAQIRAYFSPGGYCTEKIIRAIDSSKFSIYVMAYSFTSFPVAQALFRAHERGVDVKILMDRSQLKAKHSQLHFLLQQGIPVFIDPAVGIAHNKVMIFDGESVLTGSFNFSHAAETKNAENLLLIHDPALARLFQQNWEKRVRKARLLQRNSG